MEIPQTRYAKTADGLHVAYQVFGEGELDVILVPNWITHLEGQWEVPSVARALDRLASFSRLIVFDARGAGMSDPVPLDAMPTLEQRMDDVLAVMQAAGSERAALIAFESAGPLSMMFAATYPDRTTALVLANSHARILSDDDYEIGAPPDWVAGNMGLVTETWGRGVPIAGLTESEEERTMRIWARYQRQAASPGTAAAMIRSMLESDVRAVLPNIRVPTLVLSHESPSERAYEQAPMSGYLAAHIPDAKMLEIPGDESADLNVFVDEIREFLTGVRETTEADRVLATVLFSDIVGSTEMASRLGDREWGGLLNAHDEVVRRQLDRYRGNEVKRLGDGFMATFDGPARAIRCASAMIEALRRLDLNVRIGMHTGEVEIRDDDVGGIAVHIAARVSALAESSQVLVSRTVTDLVTGSGIRFADAGAHELRGLPGTWQLFSVEP